MRLLLCTTLCIYYLAAYVSAITSHQHTSMIKRQAIASRSCGNENNTISICSPSASSVWSNDTDQEITWKWNNPTLIPYDTLDLYLLYKNDTTTTAYQVVKTWPGLERTRGVLVQHVDDTWYPSEMKPLDTNNISWTMYFYIVGSGYDIQSDLDLIPSQHNFFPIPQVFTLLQNPRNTTNETTTAKSPSPEHNPDNGTTSTSSSTDKKLPGWAIAVIVIVVVIVASTIAALIWAYRRYKKKTSVDDSNLNLNRQSDTSDDEKIPVLLAAPSKSESNVMMPSTLSGITTATTAVPMSAAAINSSVPPTLRTLPPTAADRHDDSITATLERPSLAEINSQHQSSSILSSTDALMIADTFRQFMRKPEWDDELEESKKQKYQHD